MQALEAEAESEEHTTAAPKISEMEEMLSQASATGGFAILHLTGV